MHHVNKINGLDKCWTLPYLASLVLSSSFSCAGNVMVRFVEFFLSSITGAPTIWESATSLNTKKKKELIMPDKKTRIEVKKNTNRSKRAGESDRKMTRNCIKNSIRHSCSNKKFSTVDIAVFIKLNGVILDFERDIEEARYFSPPW